MSNTPDETLKGLLETAKGARLSPADEEQAFNLLKEAVAAGKKGLPMTLEALVVLPWSLGVKAVAETWPNLKPTTQRQLLAAVNKLDSEQGKRMRLSIARGLFALDQAVSIKLILKFCSEMDCESAKERQQFSNVLIGKTKPWVTSIPVKDLKPAEANALSKCVLVACQQAPAFTQIAIYAWIADAGLFAKLSDEQISAMAATIKRWQPRWHKELKKTVANLPAQVEEALTEAASKQKEAPAAAPKVVDIHIPYPGRPGKSQRQKEPAPQAQKLPQPEEKPSTPEETAPEVTPAPAPEARAPRQEKQEPKAAQKPGPTAPANRQQKEQQRNQQRPAGAQGSQGAGFDLQRSLGEIQSFVNGLKAENAQLKNQLRKRENGEPREKSQPSSEELETLRRHNLQLEETIAHLRHDVEELISDHEDRASTLEHSDELKQFKTLLGFKLGKDYFDFEALRRESATEVVRRHLGDLLDHIFSVLKNEGIDFKDEE